MIVSLIHRERVSYGRSKFAPWEMGWLGYIVLETGLEPYAVVARKQVLAAQQRGAARTAARSCCVVR